MEGIDAAKYSHSPVHKAVLRRDHAALQCILASLPRISQPSRALTEAESIAEEEKADAISAVIDRRDVSKRETPLHLAVKLADVVSVEMLMAAGADSSLQNKQGWSPLQEAICAREELIAKIIIRYYQPMAWAKWCRRMPRIVTGMSRMRDFYMEINFHFESSVIPFISRIAPSDTYRIWKRGSNLRADMTLSGFDGFKIQRAEQSVVFLGEGSIDGRVKPGSLCLISHKDKEVVNALDGAGALASDEELQHEVAAMLRTNVLRPGLDVTRAVLLPQMNWRKQQRSEMVGQWKAKVYNMHHVVVSVKSRCVPGAMTDEQLFATGKNDGKDDVYGDMLSGEEKKQLEAALKMEDSDTSSYNEQSSVDDMASTSHVGGDDVNKVRDGWLGHWKKKGKGHKHYVEKNDLPSRRSFCGEEKVSDLLEDTTKIQQKNARHSIDSGSSSISRGPAKKIGANLENEHRLKDSGKDSEFRKGLRPVLWLSSDFPLQTEELIPLLDILANKVKAIRRLRELLITKLPTGTFPVKVAIPVIPTVRVLVTFTKFEELKPPPAEEFSTPPSSPGREFPLRDSSNSWTQWLIDSYYSPSSSRPKSSPEHRHRSYSTDLHDPFMIPSDYKCKTSEVKKKEKMLDANGKLQKRQG